MYPEKLLCRHFWNENQQLIFGQRAFYKKLPLYNNILSELLIHSDKHLTDNDNVAKNILIDTIKKVF